MRASIVPAGPARTGRSRQRGVTLVEALVALTILAIGLIASLGVQSTLRLNADIARQRSEATRMAQSVIAGWRSIASDARNRAPLGTALTWGDIANELDEVIIGQNATYTVQREVVEPAGNERKDVRVTVSWVDRQGQPQSVRLITSIARQSLRSTALLLNPVAAVDAFGVAGRAATIPRAARDLGNGKSVFTPPGSSSRRTDNVWIFDNVTGLVTSVCTVPTVWDMPWIAGDVDSGTSCRRFDGQLLSGRVLFATAPVQPTRVDALMPTGTALNLQMRLAMVSTQPQAPVCSDDAPSTSIAAASRTAVNYYCLIAADSSTHAWEGYLTVVPRAFSDLAVGAWVVAPTDPSFTAADAATAAAASPTSSSLDPDEPASRSATPTHRLCRYTPAASTREAIDNPLHPWFYRTVYADPASRTGPQPMPALVQQNFLVIRSAYACPSDAEADVAAGRFVSANTLFHAPWP